MTPDEGRLFPHLLRKPGVRVWQCVMALALMAFLVLVVQVGLSLFEIVLFGGFGSMMGVQADGGYAGAAPVLYVIGLRVLYIGFAVAAVCWAFTVRPGWVVSVAERIRWRVLLRVLPAAVVALVVELLGTRLDGSGLAAVDPATVHEVANPLGWAAVAVLAALVGAAMDEVVFRGWLAQSVGALVPAERAAVVLAGVASCAGYAWWRAPSTPAEWIWTLLVGAVLFAVTTLAGGLEASFAVSVGLALALLVPYAVSRGLDVAYASRASVVDVVAAALAGAVAVLLARRAGAAHRGRPEGEHRTLSDLSGVRGVR